MNQGQLNWITNFIWGIADGADTLVLEKETEGLLAESIGGQQA